MAKNKSTPHFEVHPSVVSQLGESLISDAIQALIELVKNCYDADASYAKVIIDTQGGADIKDAIYSSDKGRIIVEDNGHGMDLEDVDSGWLTISNRKKRTLKENRETTRGGRTPLGDKGLGRLGVQRLGDNLEIFTKAEGDSGYHFGFSWTDFAKAAKLEDVDIHLTDYNFEGKHGTRVVVSGLREPEFWKGDDAIKRLEQELSRMISPFRQIRDFMVLVEVDGKTLELQEISDQVRDIAPVKYSIKFDGKQIVFHGYARLDFFRTSKPEDLKLFPLIAEADNGKHFFEFLSEQKHAQALELTKSKTAPWFIEFSRKVTLSDIDKVQRVGNGVANPGPFHGEISAYDLGDPSFKNQSVFDRVSDYRRYIKDLSGIRVYRDGFAVRVDHDWLKLGAQWTSASSYYGLKPNTTLGYIALSARDNMLLEETTDREGFKDTPYYRNFYLLMSEFTAFTTTAHEFFGRSWAEFRNARNERLASIDSRKSLEDILRTIKTGLSEASVHRENLSTFKTRLSKSVSDSKSAIAKMQTAKEVTPALRAKVTAVLADSEPLLAEARDTIDTVSGYLKKISSLEADGQALDNRVDTLKEQMDAMYETVALGLTAEALSHEVYNVADQLAKRAKNVQLAAKKRGIEDRSIMAFIEYVQTAVMALRKQMSYLSPSLRFVREQRHDINLRDFLIELKDFYDERMKKNNISFVISGDIVKQFSVRMNKGKLAQIIDNLVINSEYWLKEDIAQGRIESGVLTLDISHPFVYVFDNGSGIDSKVEGTLFEPFVSAKSKGQGRGLGLFIVKQLLDSEGCSIDLVPERNRRRRFFKFQIDLRGACNE